MLLIGGFHVIRAIKEKFASWILEILIVVFSAIGAFIWGLHTTNAEQSATIRVNSGRLTTLEAQIESFRKENREDHKEILDELREVIKNTK